MQAITYLHNANAGDLIGALAGIRAIHRKTGRKAIIYQQLDVLGAYIEGTTHPVRDADGNQVMFNKTMFEMMRPLLLAQDYVEDFIVYEGQPATVPLTRIRGDGRTGEINVNIPYGMLPSWTILAFPDMACDLSEPWLTIPDPIGYLYEYALPDSVIVSRTERYKNHGLNYFFLKQYQDRLIFAGTEEEHKKFCSEWKLDFPRLQLDNFLQLAQALKSCKFLLGNQSMIWNMANAAGLPRLLEICWYAPNCQPFIGKDNYGFLFQQSLEFYFNELINR